MRSCFAKGQVRKRPDHVLVLSWLKCLGQRTLTNQSRRQSNDSHRIVDYSPMRLNFNHWTIMLLGRTTPYTTIPRRPSRFLRCKENMNVVFCHEKNAHSTDTNEHSRGSVELSHQKENLAMGKVSTKDSRRSVLFFHTPRCRVGLSVASMVAKLLGLR